MNLPDDKTNLDLQLRAVAEMQLEKSPMLGGAARSAEELLHDLQVHQIELEESRDRYLDLYELTLVGYYANITECKEAEVQAKR